MHTKKILKVALLCGGPSLERGISLNSARSVMDHLSCDYIEITPIFIDTRRQFHLVSKALLYSNTPSDFDFKIKTHGKKLTQHNLIKTLKSHDIVFPALHGAFGEDGQLQSFLEKHNIPYVGSSHEACSRAFDKYESSQYLKKYNFATVPIARIRINDKNKKKVINDFFRTNNITRAIVKPARGGSSIGVFSVDNPIDAYDKVHFLFSKRYDTRVVIEQFIEGTEFTTIILQNEFNQPVAILPTEISVNYSENQIFDFRKKYLPTRHVSYHCPPHFSNETIEHIQVQSEQLFSLFNMRDYARFDGWITPQGILFTDFNPISGMEQNSFLFQQASRIGLSHSGILRHILFHACRRYGIDTSTLRSLQISAEQKIHTKKDIHILCGGDTSEKNVSLMSGTNVWLKLLKSNQYNPILYLVSQGEVWKLPYTYALNHTTEEIIDTCTQAIENQSRLQYLEEKVVWRLRTIENTLSNKELPVKMLFDAWLDEIGKNSDGYVFLALHGGDGENGIIQEKLQQRNISYNGSDSVISKLCMNKYDTNTKINTLAIDGVSTTAQYIVDLPIHDVSKAWKDITSSLKTKKIIVKPVDDGCSTGVARIYSAIDLKTYIDHVQNNTPTLPAHSLTNQNTSIDMPTTNQSTILCEAYIDTDIVRVKNNTLKHTHVSGYIEVTTGVIELQGKLHALHPSITIAEDAILSLEEKFQGGTGVNITPPPETIIPRKVLEIIKNRHEKLSKEIGIRNYARIDSFVHIRTGEVIVIEINTLPGLTPATVLFHQALAEHEPLYPQQLLEKIITSSYPTLR